MERDGTLEMMISVFTGLMTAPDQVGKSYPLFAYNYSGKSNQHTSLRRPCTEERNIPCRRLAVGLYKYATMWMI